ncbi:hypothetical protein L3Q82_001606 [Scortum barcoo]|uniref:Uncharacterized protein n=1 Tax=Scortum barcoo TaxID=214431 RepID=A0ACB8W3J6_9TELE|nr:hypothetical protein L3Q82_001606 [Scortum barcoo]
MPRLELCAALTGAQLFSLIHKKLTLCIAQTFLWTDSTTVLTWLTSQSCRFKVFVGTRVSDIQELTDSHTWRYVDTANNPADDLTRGKTLDELAAPSRWIQGPAFLRHPPDEWPSCPSTMEPEDNSELKQSVFCALTQTSSPLKIPDVTQFCSWRELVKATQQSLHGAAADFASPLCDFRDAEVHLVKASQADCFSEEVRRLRASKPVSPSNKLSTLAPELDPKISLMCWGTPAPQRQL